MEYNPYESSNIENIAGGYNTYASISGKVTKLSQAYYSAVYLCDPLTMKTIATLSNKIGEFQFKGLPKGKSFVLFSRDINRNYNAVIQDNVVPK